MSEQGLFTLWITLTP